MHRIDSSTATPDGRFTEGKPPLFDAALAQDSTDYWLPDDTNATPARCMRLSVLPYPKPETECQK